MSNPTEIAALFNKTFDSITEEFEPEDFAVLEDVSSRIHKMQPGAMARLVTFAERSVILIGTPLGVISIEQAYPKDSTRIRLNGSKHYQALFPNPLSDYMGLTDLVFCFGDPEEQLGSKVKINNIGVRLDDAYSSMIHRTTHRFDGAPYNIALDNKK